MKRMMLAVAAMAAGVASAQAPVPIIEFESVPEPLKLPKDLYFGEVTGVAVNSKGMVYVLSRGNTTGPAYAAAASQLLEFKPDGTFSREIGHNLYAWSFGHAVRVDREDNIWAVDKGSDMVVKFSPAGKVLMVFGRKQEASDEETGPVKHPKPPLPAEDGRFRQVTDVTWDPQGNIFISDGYINSRVAKFTKDGDWVASIGEPGRTKIGELNTPHTISYDAKGNIYVGDRGNRRIQVIDPKTNTLVREIKIDVPVPPDAKPWMGATPTAEGAAAQAGAPWAICVTPPNAQGQQFLYSSDAFPGRVYKLSVPDGKVLGWLGKSGHQAKQFGWIHEIACPSENELYVAELLNWRLQKLTLKPAGTKSTAAGQ
jgi:DNA-binding beta-propeller fold protein YncE